jgi:hypothetical protein
LEACPCYSPDPVISLPPIVPMKYQKPPNHINLSLNWELDPEYDGFFQKGARDKKIYFSPAICDEEFIIPNFRYLFKESIYRHPNQYWSEIVAFRISSSFHVTVPPAFAATTKDPETGDLVCGTLIEWFYDTESRLFLEYKEAGDFLSIGMPTFDRKTGSDHNFQDNFELLSFLSKHKKFILSKNWIRDFLSMFLFDIVIGNTDRHQDNWGVIIEKYDRGHSKITLSPAYDNGTSLGYEIVDSKLSQFTNPSKRLAYINKGKHHMRKYLGGNRFGHFEIIKELITKSPSTKHFLADFFDIDFTIIRDSVMELTSFTSPVPLKPERAEFMLSLSKDRITLAVNTISDNS